MDPFSIVAGVVTLLDAACKSSKLIYAFFQGMDDGPFIIQSHCVFLQALQENLAELRNFCTVRNIEIEQVMRLSSNVDQCLKILKTVERRILIVDRRIRSGSIRRTLVLVQWAVLKGDLWVDSFFDQIKMWQSIFACDLVLLQL